MDMRLGIFHRPKLAKVRYRLELNSVRRQETFCRDQFTQRRVENISESNTTSSFVIQNIVRTLWRSSHQSWDVGFWIVALVCFPNNLKLL
ncbi:hypothetical protein UFOVP375_8 [uncultured Caudovirales phage]|uniref:Uncharacterized protein n=1 Tax=uncultured Caudovirales phage TaxID=2100421 RepID=A0A6J7XWG5_9CAUD|nr:hypothetical protein UFOVP375_8 [uncultured Caudovirales phage]